MRLWKAAIELAGEDDARVLLKRATECCPQVCAGPRVTGYVLWQSAQHMQCYKDEDIEVPLPMRYPDTMESYEPASLLCASPRCLEAFNGLSALPTFQPEEGYEADATSSAFQIY